MFFFNVPFLKKKSLNWGLSVLLFRVCPLALEAVIGLLSLGVPGSEVTSLTSSSTSAMDWWDVCLEFFLLWFLLEHLTSVQKVQLPSGTLIFLSYWVCIDNWVYNVQCMSFSLRLIRWSLVQNPSQPIKSAHFTTKLTLKLYKLLMYTW